MTGRTRITPRALFSHGPAHVSQIAAKRVAYVHDDALLDRLVPFCARRVPNAVGYWAHAAFPWSATDYAAQPLAIWRVDGARLCGVRGGLVFRDDSYEVEASYFSFTWTDDGALQRDGGGDWLAGEPALSVKRPAYVFFNGGHTNYAHWLTDHLYNLWLRRQRDDLRKLPLLVPAKLTRFAQDTLSLLGFDAADRIEATAGHVFLKRLFMPAPFGLGTIPRDYDRAAAMLSERVEAGPRDRALYVSRRDAGARPLLNASDLETALTAIGFEPLVTGDMSLCEQIAAFKGARAVIAPHGAGLANMIFAPRGTMVLELFPEYATQPHFWTLASRMGHRYGFIQGTSFTHDNAAYEVAGNWEAPWVIDVDAVVGAARRMLDESARPPA